MDDRRRSDPRLAAYLIAGIGALLVAIAAGRPEVVALGTPFIVLAMLGHGRGVPERLDGSVSLDTDRLIEGSEIEGTIRVDWDGVAEVDVVLAGLRGVTPVEPTSELGWSLPAGTGPATLTFRIRATSWGVHQAGTLWIRARRPGGLVIREEKLAESPTLRVLPSPLRLNSLLRPTEPRAVAGAHLSRRRGHGTDLAELRAYQPGDRLRDLSWATSARLGAPWVKVQHPERTGTVLLLLDSFMTSDGLSVEVLARAARAAWAVASVHLRAQDRVGLLAKEGTAVWVPPQGGRRARLQLMEKLLSVGGAAQTGWGPRYHRSRVLIPADALIVGVTSLRSWSFMLSLIHHRRSGHATAALVIDTSDLLPEASGAADRAAHRIWIAQRDAMRYRLDRSRVPTALVTETHGVASAVSSLRRRMDSVVRAGVAV